jgi:hypothetical protein
MSNPMQISHGEIVLQAFKKYDPKDPAPAMLFLGFAMAVIGGYLYLPGMVERIMAKNRNATSGARDDGASTSQAVQKKES